jgi:hypothetical protein
VLQDDSVLDVEQEAGAKTADVCRKHGVSNATFYKWKAIPACCQDSEIQLIEDPLNAGAPPPNKLFVSRLESLQRQQ